MELLLTCQLTAAAVLAWTQRDGHMEGSGPSPSFALRYWTILMAVHLATALAMQVRHHLAMQVAMRTHMRHA